MACWSFHLMPESRTAITASGRPVETCDAVRTGWPETQLPAGCVVAVSTMLAPRTPQSSSCWLLTFVVRGFDDCSGVAASFQSPVSLKSFGAVPGGSLNVCGLWGSPPLGGRYGNAAYAVVAHPAAISAQ